MHTSISNTYLRGYLNTFQVGLNDSRSIISVSELTLWLLMKEWTIINRTTSILYDFGIQINDAAFFDY